MLTEQQLNLFNKNGFLVVDHVLDDEDLLPLQREYAELLESLARELYHEGKIDSAFADCNFDECFTHSGVGNTAWPLFRRAIRLVRTNMFRELSRANRRCLPILSITVRANPYR